MIRGRTIIKNFPYRNFWREVAANKDIINKCNVLPKLLHIKIGNTVETHWNYEPGLNSIFIKNGNRVRQYEKCVANLEKLHKKHNLVHGNLLSRNILQDSDGEIKFWGLNQLDVLPGLYLSSEEYDGEENPLELTANDHYMMANGFLWECTIEEQLRILEIYNKIAGYLDPWYRLSPVNHGKYHYAK